jgi:hypothetical protein
MSQMGQKRTSERVRVMSTLPPKATFSAAFGIEALVPFAFKVVKSNELTALLFVLSIFLQRELGKNFCAARHCEKSSAAVRCTCVLSKLGGGTRWGLGTRTGLDGG